MSAHTPNGHSRTIPRTTATGRRLRHPIILAGLIFGSSGLNRRLRPQPPLIENPTQQFHVFASRLQLQLYFFFLSFFRLHDSLQFMKSLTVVLVLLASSPAFSCPFHGIFFSGDDDSARDPRAFMGNIVGENSKSTNEKKPQNFYQFKAFESRLTQWKEET